MSKFHWLWGLICCVLVVAPSLAHEDTSPLLQMLHLVPDTPEIRVQIIEFGEYRIVWHSRPGITMPNTRAEYTTLHDQDDPAAALWFWSLPAVTWFRDNASVVVTDEMVNTMGFEFFDVEQSLSFGAPPAHATILKGNFDEDQLDTALTAEGFVKDTVSDFTRWCSPDGCETGKNTDLQAHNNANLFGGNLGRKQPTLLGGNLLFTSPDAAVTDAMVQAYNHEIPSLAEAADYRGGLAALFTPQPDIAPRTIHFIPPALVTPVEFPENAEVLPPYKLLILGDMLTVGEQWVMIVLVYEDEQDAETALTVVQSRLETLDSASVQRPFKELIEERGGETWFPQVVVDKETGLASVVLSYRYPVPPNEPNEEGQFVQTGLLYQLFLNTIYQRDTAWISP